jgi:hypothetical protein
MKMKSQYSLHRFGKISILILLIFIGMIIWGQSNYSVLAQTLISPNGKYEAVRVSQGNGNVHYQIQERASGHILMTSRAQYKTPNDVKVGAFSSDSKQFAAAYHYSHKGKYTWIGVWTIATGSFRRETKISGFVRSIPPSVFEISPKPEPQGIWWKVSCSCIDPYAKAIVNIRVCMVHTGAADLSCGLLANQIGGGTRCTAIAASRLDGPTCNPIPGNFTVIR